MMAGPVAGSGCIWGASVAGPIASLCSCVIATGSDVSGKEVCVAEECIWLSDAGG